MRAHRVRCLVLLLSIDNFPAEGHSFQRNDPCFLSLPGFPLRLPYATKALFVVVRMRSEALLVSFI